MTPRTQSLDPATHPDAATESTFVILAVCQANLYRSPIIEVVLGAAADRHLDPCERQLFDFRSAGTRAISDRSSSSDVEHLLAAHGYTARPNPPCQLTPAMITGADLILTADRAQRAGVVAAVPAATRKTFTLRQFARLCEAGRPGPQLPSTGAGLRALAERGRSRVAAGREDDDTIADPVGGGIAALNDTLWTVEQCAQQIFGGGGERDRG